MRSARASRTPSAQAPAPEIGAENDAADRRLQVEAGGLAVETLAAEGAWDKLIASSKDDPFIGRKDAAITIVEFSDYDCGVCKSAMPWVISQVDDRRGDIKLIIKEAAWRGEGSHRAAMSALAAHNQGKYREMHIALMKMPSSAYTPDILETVAKSIGQEVPMLAGRKPGPRAMVVGMWTMIVFALLGNIPMIAGTDILKATTISGTMVMGLAPIFLLAPLVRHSPWSFHLAFWPGIVLGVLLATGMIPPSWAIGDGKYALLLGVNFYGLGLCITGFLLPVAWQALSGKR